MSVLALNEDQIAQSAGLDELLSLYEVVVVTADLTNHQHGAGLLGNLQQFVAVFLLQSHGLLQQDGLAITQESGSDLAVGVVGSGNDNSVHLGVTDQFLVVGASLLNAVLLLQLFCAAVFAGVADSVAVALGQVQQTCKMAVSNSARANHGNINLTHNITPFLNSVSGN